MAHNFPISSLLTVTLLSFAFTGVLAGRSLDETPTYPFLPSPVLPISPEAAAPTAIPTVLPPLTPSPMMDVPPPPTVLPPPSNTGNSHTINFFMHDVIGGIHPTSRVVTGIGGSSATNNGLPFVKAAGNKPYLAGLGGINLFQNGGAGGGTLPFASGGQLPAGAAATKAVFGTITVIDEVLTVGHELTSTPLGKAQGFYVASSQDGSSHTMAFTALLQSGEYADTISFFGVHRTAVEESHIAVIGGTGKYENAQGYAIVQTLPPVDAHETDGFETVLQFSVNLY